jgi:transposase InsO family protein
MGLLDTGAELSFIDIQLTEKYHWSVKPQTGYLDLAVSDKQTPRIGVICDAIIRAGKHEIVSTLEVAKLSGNTQFIIGMDIFHQLGFKLNDIPFTWPQDRPSIKQNTTTGTLVVADRQSELSNNIDKDGIASEWKNIIKDNLELPVSSVCKLPNAIISINTGDSTPSYVRQYPVPQALASKVKARVEEWYKNGWVVDAPRGCRWNSPILAAPKPSKDKNEPDDIRVCLDARFLNDKIIEMPDSNLPLLRDIIDKLGQFKWVSVIDLADSYHQFALREEDQPKTTFTFEGKQSMFKVTPFGLKVMTGNMQRIMEHLLGDLGVIPFQDDVVIASNTEQEHVVLVSEVLRRITYVAGLRIKPKKCKFFQTEARILGMIVARSGIKMDPKKIEAITNWPRPINGKAMQRFMGAANFHREFSHAFAKVAAPLDECRNLKKIDWTPDRINSFEKLKDIFKQNIELQHIDWNKTVYLTADASQFGIGAWIGQMDKDGILLPVICVSKKLSDTQQRWSATKRELYALVWSVKRLRQYLLGRHFIARVDHKPLVALLKNKSTMLIEGWLETLMEFSFSTEYLPGEQNIIADALSRCHEGITVCAISAAEKQHQELLWEAEIRGLILLESNQRIDMINQNHALGHFGAKHIAAKFRDQGYWWPGMTKDIENQIRNCHPCLCYNVEKEGFHPAKSITASEPWDHIQIDLIGPLPISQNGFSYILTVIDVCTGYTVLRAAKNKEMESIARLMWGIFCEYGTPRILQSDNGTEFANQVMKSLTVIYGIDHRLSTSYHPNTNGLVERQNKEVSRSLKKYVEGTYASWDDWIPLVQVGLNESINTRTGSAAFALMFNRKFNGFRDFSKVNTPQDFNKIFSQVQDTWKNFKTSVLPGILARTKLIKSQQELRLNQRKQAVQFEPGAAVMILNHQKSSKWEPHYDGPYTIDKQHEGGSYSLYNALNEVINGRYTSDMLKLIEKNNQGSTNIQLNSDKSSFEIHSIVDHKSTPHGYEYFVRWKGYPDSDNSWVKATEFDSLNTITKYWKKLKKSNKNNINSNSNNSNTLTSISSTKGLGGSHVRSKTNNYNPPKKGSNKYKK